MKLPFHFIFIYFCFCFFVWGGGVLLEPPDVRNWFLSYEYESPVLGTIDGFKDPVTRDSGCFVSKESTKETENHIITSEVLETECIYLIIHKVRVSFI